MALKKCGCDQSPPPSLEYLSDSHSLVWKDGKGELIVIPLNTPDVTCAPNGFTFIDERGQTQTCTFAEIVGITDLAYDPATGILSWVDKAGTPQTQQIANTSLSYDNVAHVVTATSPEHGVQALDLNVGRLSLVGTDVLRYVSEDATVTDIQLPNVDCVYDAGLHRLTLTDIRGIPHTCDLNVGALAYDAATHALTYTDEHGTPTTITLGSTAVAYDLATHDLTVTRPGQAPAVIDLNVATIEYVNGAHQIRYRDEENMLTTLSLAVVAASYDEPTNTLTIVNERGVPISIPLGSTRVVYDPATHDITVDRPGMAPSTLDLNVATPSYDNAAHIWRYVDEEGAATNIPLNVGSVAFNLSTRTLTYTREDGTAQQVVIPDKEGDVVSYDAATSTLTITHPDGTTEQVVMAGNGALVYNATTHALQFTDSNGATATLVLNVGGLAWAEGTRMLTYTDERGTATPLHIAKGDMVAYDPITKVIKVTHEDGSEDNIPNGASELVYDPVGETVTHTNSEGVVVTFPTDQVGFVYDDAAQTLTLSDRHGNAVVVPVCCATMTFDASTGDVVWTNGNAVTTFKVGDQVTQLSPTSYRVTKPDGTTFDIDTGNPSVVETLSGCLVDNTDPNNPVVMGVKTLTLATDATTQALFTITDDGACNYVLSAVPQGPYAMNDVAGLHPAGVPFVMDVTVNDTPCPTGQVTAYQVHGVPVNATVAMTASGTATVTPTAPGAFSFRYDILCDGAVTATADVAGSAPAATAAAVDDAVGNHALAAPFNVNVTTNDTACDVGATTYALNGAPTGPVSVVMSAAGVATVTPTGAGAFSFAYDILCAGTVTDNANVTGTIDSATADAVNDAVGPHVAGTQFTTNLAANDVSCSAGTTTYQMNGPATNATVSVAANGTATITPTAVGAFSFDYDILCDGVVTDTATVTGNAPAITADAVNDAVGPHTAGTQFTASLSANDVPCSSGTTTYQMNGSATNATVSVASNGTATITPTAVGAFSFNYDILCDGVVTDTATVTGNAPSATADAVDDAVGPHAAGTQFTANLSANDTACSSGTTTYQMNGSATNATVSVAANGTATITPTAVGAFSFNYDILCDGAVTDTATVSGNAPAATADAVDDTVGPHTVGTQFTASLSANDVSCSFGTTTYQLNGSPTNATVSVAANGTATITPTAAGAFSFSYDILCDGVVTDTANVAGTGTSITADAVDHDVGPRAAGTQFGANLAENDVPCSSGTTTYQLNGTPTNATVSVASNGLASVTPTAAGAFSFNYDLLCDGVVLDTAALTGTGTATNTPPSPSIISVTVG